MSLLKTYAERGGGKVPRRLSNGMIVMEREFGGMTKSYDQQPANKYWAEHYAALLQLDRMTTDYTKSTAERRDAQRAMMVCQRKLDHWARHRNYNTEQAARDAARLKREAGR